jgi:gliding motility-associated-like protein
MALMATDNTFNAYDIGDEYEERAWYVDGVLQSLTSRNLMVTMPDDKDTTCVMLWVSDGHCADSTSFCVPRLYNQIAVPNAFTPDADDDNNVFRISGKGILRGELQVFNRNGVLVFRTTNLEEGWDGHDIHGNRCPMGNYVWHLRYVSTVRPDSHHDTTGMVLLIR